MHREVRKSDSRPQPRINCLFRRHPDPAVDTNDLGVHIRVGHQFDDHRSQFVGAAQAVWEQYRFAQLRLERLRGFAFTVDRGIDQAGRDGVDPDPGCGEVTRTGSVMPTTPPLDDE
jgi:hypothetical protein